jgi:hypothetical protein
MAASVPPQPCPMEIAIEPAASARRSDYTGACFCAPIFLCLPPIKPALRSFQERK